MKTGILGFLPQILLNADGTVSLADLSTHSKKPATPVIDSTKAYQHTPGSQRTVGISSVDVLAPGCSALLDLLPHSRDSLLPDSSVALPCPCSLSRNQLCCVTKLVTRSLLSPD